MERCQSRIIVSPAGLDKATFPAPGTAGGEGPLTSAERCCSPQLCKANPRRALALPVRFVSSRNPCGIKKSKKFFARFCERILLQHQREHVVHGVRSRRDTETAEQQQRGKKRPGKKSKQESACMKLCLQKERQYFPASP